MPNLTLTKEFTFSAAHCLPNYKGNCENLHGHTYKLQVTVKGKINRKTGMIIDFHELNDIVKKIILDKLDHTYLNNIIKNPTTENITIFIWKRLKPFLNLYEVIVWESSTAFASYRD